MTTLSFVLRPQADPRKGTDSTTNKSKESKQARGTDLLLLQVPVALVCRQRTDVAFMAPKGISNSL